MFKLKENGKINWLNVILLVAGIAAIMAIIVVPGVKLIKEHLPAVQQAAENAAALIH